jgi:predicted dehydrogenase
VRVAVIGARCRNHGIGEHLARFVVRAGHDVCALLGTSRDTAREAVEHLRATTGHVARPHTELASMLASERPEVLVVASPHATHAAYLERALEAGLHVLCEKPLVWATGDDAETAERIASAYLEAGRHLAVNAQWPRTLPTWRRLFPDAPRRVPRRFAMRLSPRDAGTAMLPAAMPHALSLLAAVLPGADAELEDVTVTRRAAEHVRVAFTYRLAGEAIESRVDLVQCLEQPRPAAYGFDGHIAHRHVELDGYRLFLEGAGRRIPLPDPTPLLVGSFLEAVAAGPPAEIDPAAVPGMRHLVRILDAAAPDGAPTPP